MVSCKIPILATRVRFPGGAILLLGFLFPHLKKKFSIITNFKTRENQKTRGNHSCTALTRQSHRVINAMKILGRQWRQGAELRGTCKPVTQACWPFPGAPPEAAGPLICRARPPGNCSPAAGLQLPAGFAEAGLPLQDQLCGRDVGGGGRGPEQGSHLARAAAVRGPGPARRPCARGGLGLRPARGTLCASLPPRRVAAV